MIKKQLYKLKNLVCTYDDIHPVLYVPNLEIYAGEITLVLGRSGSGKSTLLETLGLMTNSLAVNREPYLILDEREGENGLSKSQSSLCFTKHENDQQVCFFHLDLSRNNLAKQVKEGIGHSKDPALLPIYHNKRSKERHDLRLNHFAFIFQNTNLMPNFSAEQNVAIGAMASISGKNSTFGSGDECLKRAQDTLSAIGIHADKFDRPVKELSGGERQRIAFARALNAEFSVIFGDEPTGNLDEQNSIVLMTRFQEAIKNPTNGWSKSAVIVSHNIPLSLRFADRIILIETLEYKMSDLVVARGFSEKKHIEDDTMHTYGKINNTIQYYSKPLSEEKTDAKRNHYKQWYRSQAGKETDEEVSYEQMYEILFNTLAPKKQMQ